MITETPPAAGSTNDGRTGQRRKYEIMRKCIKSYRQVFDSLITRFPGMEQKPGG